LFNNLLLVKLVLLGFFFSQEEIVPFLILIIWVLESALFFRKVFKKDLIKPVFTSKILVLTAVFLTITVLFGTWVLSEEKVFYLLFFDVLTPVLISLVVLFFQPFIFLIKKQIIKKARKKREGFNNLVVVGITGSYGKTSTKEYLTQILSKRFNVLKTSEHHNSEMGIAQCILNELKEEHQIFVCEMGAYKVGSIKLLADMAKPKIGILTGINEQHQSLFGSKENIIKTKYELVESLPDEGLAIFNGANPDCISLYEKTKKPKRITGLLAKYDLYASDIKVKKEHLLFKVSGQNAKEVDFSVNLLGKQHIENILLAIQTALYLGMDLDQIASACQWIQPQERTMEFKRAKRGVSLIDDSYNSNPKGVIAALDYLRVFSLKKVIVMPCLIELGKDAKKIHQKIGREIEKTCDLAIITTKEHFHDIKGKSPNILFLNKQDKIIEKLKGFLARGDVVLLEGRISSKIIESIYNEFL